MLQEERDRFDGFSSGGDGAMSLSVTLRRLGGLLITLLLLAACDVSTITSAGGGPAPAPTNPPPAATPQPVANTSSAPTTAPTSAPATAAPAQPVAGRTDAGGGVGERVFSRNSPAVVRIQLPQGLGSGFLIDTNGTIITNNHVVEGQQEVQVLFTGLFAAIGRVLGTDPDSDIAV